MQSNILDNLLLLVNIALGHRHVLLSLKIELGGVSIRAADALDGAGVGLDVNDITQAHALLLDSFVNGGVQAELLRALCRLQHDDQVRDGAAVAAERVLCLLGRELRDLALVHLLRFANAQT